MGAHSRKSKITMRVDMDKVIVERPRIWSRAPSQKKGYRRLQQSTPIDDLPKREPMLGRWKGRDKSLNEHLGPMRRFLRSSIGRPWNKVHQELCEHVSFDNAVQGHVLEHVDDYVYKIVEVEDRSRVFLKHPSYWFGDRLLPGEMYVCPRTGILREVYVDRRQASQARVSVSPTKQFHFRDNLWWEVQVRSSRKARSDLWDVWLEREVGELSVQDCLKAYGGEMVALSKRPLSREETKQFHRDRRKRSRRNRGRKR